MNENEIVIDEDEEAEFIQNWLLIHGYGFIETEDIKMIIKGQTEFLKEKGVIIENDED